MVVGWNFPYSNPVAMGGCSIALFISPRSLSVGGVRRRLGRNPALFGWVIRPIRCSTRCRRPTRLPAGWPGGRVSVRGGWSG